MSRHVTDATMRVRDVLYEGLLIRRGLELTEEVARERANNLAMTVMETLREMAEARADHTAREVPGQDVVSDEPPPVRETMEEHARRVIR